ncbi:hypothetical protein Nmel_011534 [Mimus melanotis]
MSTATAARGQTWSWCGKHPPGAELSAVRTGTCRRDLLPSTGPGGRNFWTSFTLLGYT